jgi:Fuc2NAc and GlcNAc transferase
MTVAIAIPIVMAFAIATFGTWLMIRFAPAVRLIDRPNQRSSHDRPTPRGGGLAIVAAVTAAASLLQPGGAGGWGLAVVAALPIAILGLLDDRFGLSARLRLGVQLAMGLAYVMAAVGGAPSAAVALSGTLAIAWACNLFNFMDGIDGIAGMEATFICAVAGWIICPQDPTLATFLWIVAASSAAFLPWNWSPARIFMGDVGSAYLGFLIAAIAFSTVVHGLIALPVWIVLWSLFLADTAVTLARRVLRREHWWTAHRTHAYQHLSARLGSHSRATLIYAAINLIVIMPSAWYAHGHSDMAWWTCGLLLLLLLAFVYACGAGKPGSVSGSNT